MDLKIKKYKSSIPHLRGFRDLIISPHVDDEVLGCASVLGRDSFVYYCGIDESRVDSRNSSQRPPLEERLGEIEAVAGFLGFDWMVNLDARVNHYDEVELIGEFENVINQTRPERIFIPFPSYNQDHRTVYEAVHVALRPHDENHFVRKVLVYEQEHPILWEDKPIKVNYFVPLDVERKVSAYSLHASQVRDMRSFDLLEAIAKIRGKSSNRDFAEAFIIERWVD